MAQKEKFFFEMTVLKEQLKKKLLSLQTECMLLLPSNYVESDIILANMRKNVIKNIIRVTEDFELHKTTAFLAISCFDRFMSHTLKSGNYDGPNVHIVAFTCLLISAKYLDTKLPPHSQLKKIFDKHNVVVNVNEFVSTELSILGCLSWRISHSTSPSTYMNYIMELCNTEKVYHIWLEWIEIALNDSRFLNIKPCTVCITALCVTWKLCNDLSNVRQHIDDFCMICECDSKEISCHMYKLYESKKDEMPTNG